jgi:AAA15 family ATPase/GTPase
MTTNPEGKMREILSTLLGDVYGNDEISNRSRQFQNEHNIRMVDQALSAIKEELLRVMPKEEKTQATVSHVWYESEYDEGHNKCRSQMITAIETLFEEK